MNLDEFDTRKIVHVSKKVPPVTCISSFKLSNCFLTFYVYIYILFYNNLSLDGNITFDQFLHDHYWKDDNDDISLTSRWLVKGPVEHH